MAVNSNSMGNYNYVLFGKFYSKSQAKVAKMDKKKLLEFVMDL